MTTAIKNINRALDAAREAAADERDGRGVGGVGGRKAATRRKVLARKAARRASKALRDAAVCGDF